MARRTRLVALLTLATINLVTLVSAIAVARMLPARLAALRVPYVRAGTVAGEGAVLPAGAAHARAMLPTTAGLRAALDGTLGEAALGPHVVVIVTDPLTGQVLLSQGGGQPAEPASTAKIATAAAALAVLGGEATFTTSVVQAGPGRIIVKGGGDPTLAVHAYPAQDYPEPATLAALAAATARALKAEGRTSVQLGYDTSLYQGPGLAPGWPPSYVTSGDTTQIVPLEVDQGRLTATGAPEDADDPGNYKPRADHPAEMAAAAFAALLASDGVAVAGSPVSQQAPAGAKPLASVSSPPVAAQVAQMLTESNNVIADNLARHVALALGYAPSFAGAAAAITRELRVLGVRGPFSMVDGSGLSPLDQIAPVTLVRLLRTAIGTPALRGTLTGLPVAGFTGTLSAGGSVFGAISGAARGAVRAKTGNLDTVAALAGLVDDKDGTLLAFAIMADRVTALDQAAAAIDAAAGELAGCGCRLPQLSAYGGTVSSAQMIDWELAVSTGVRWARPGPHVSLAEARQTVAELKDLARAVAEPVQEVTGMISAEEAGRVAVVDRPGWIRANVDGFRVVLEPLVERLRDRAPGGAGVSVLSGVGSKVTGMQAGLILAYLSSRVLGQYELFLPPAAPGEQASVGRLTLVAPNIVMVERELDVDPHDFRLWVCLHEETHRLQFTAVPWLRGYVQSQMTEFLLASELDPGAILGRLRAAAEAVRSDGGSLIEAVVSPAQREIMDRLTAVMTLVEGHGDYVMDAVGPQVVPSVSLIRERFTARRGSAGRVEQALRRLLGIDLKMKQYAEGAKFVRTVVEEAGMTAFNKVWTSPETLPDRDELAEPGKWLDRVAR